MVCGHTKNYIKVLIAEEEKRELLGKCVEAKVIGVTRWHLEGKVIKYTPEIDELDKDYFENSYEKRRRRMKRETQSKSQVKKKKSGISGFWLNVLILVSFLIIAIGVLLSIKTNPDS
jgi:hypothetical protein